MNCSNSPTIVVNASATFNAVFKGTGGVLVAGNRTLTLGSKNTYTAGTTVNGGTLVFGTDNQGTSYIGKGTLTINAGGTVTPSSGDNPLGYQNNIIHNLVVNGGTYTTAATGGHWVDTITMTGGVINGLFLDEQPWSGYANTFVINPSVVASTISLNALNLYTTTTFNVAAGGTASVSSAIARGGGLTKTGAGVLILSGANTFTGTTTISGGTLLVNGSIGAGAVTVQTNGTLGGTGSIAVAATVQSGGALAPGVNGVGTLATGAQSWNGGGSYLCELNSTNTSGCDLVNITGALALQASAANPFTIRPISLAAGNTPGRLASFNKFRNYSWTIAAASAGVSNFAANAFSVDASGFANDTTGGQFAVQVSGNALLLQYLAAPAISPQFTNVVLTTNQALRLSGTGGAGQAYVLYATTNLPAAAWTAISTNLADTNGLVQFLDPGATNYPQRFYRLAAPQ